MDEAPVNTDRNALLAVIGTAGRQEDAARISRALYDAMYAEVLRAMAGWDVRGLVSGGAAVADHLAVRAFLDGRAERLVLHFPAPFRDREFVRQRQALSDDAGTANRYHRQFSAACGLDSLGEIAEAMARGAETHAGLGFAARNLDVAAAATHMVALTFGPAGGPADPAPDPACHAWTGPDGIRRKVSADFLPDAAGFSEPAAAGLGGRGTPHTWRACWKAEVKRHVNLTLLERCLLAAQASEVPLAGIRAAP
jgi:hypothetical protein